MKELLLRWLDLNPVNATIKGRTPAGIPATLSIRNSSRRKINHYADMLIEKDWYLEEITIDA